MPEIIGAFPVQTAASDVIPQLVPELQIKYEGV